MQKVESRRPIRSRQSEWAHVSARWLQSRGITPNEVSLASIAFAGCAGVALLWAGYSRDYFFRMVFFFAAAAFIQLRLVCNLLDGIIAVEGGMKSPAGEIYNDLPDRLSDTLIFVCAGYAASDYFNAVAAGWTAAVLAMLTAYIRVLGASAGAPHFFIGPMAKQHRMAIMTAACIFAMIGSYFSRDIAGHVGSNESSPGIEMHFIAIGLWIIVAGAGITSLRRSKQVLGWLNANRR